jgi:transcriptional regulator with XRE-family HTH domain
MRFGPYIRMVRELKRRHDARYSSRQVSTRIGVEAAYLSKVEREAVAPPSEATIRRLAAELDTDPEMLLAMAGKVADDVQAIIRERPQLMTNALRAMANLPEATVRRLLADANDAARGTENTLGPD